ncbi:hypothetical protein L228DRAFT_245329 [Xylona heveae TC161]|uniref:Sphingolipid long chain base-responsive protein LSP1 n=1 Tax=Xylona heveae (strain CBS 132557 / TC161) TaxID=1328760 RepID=A0A165I573_XYLHT|nr:hypothetical protein L228DRAFT_245329 [Xylona heveae TC161]KZF24402.1 hypothetical protein L228DRAFT_245329 [Xylona heveae TC161]
MNRSLSIRSKKGDGSGAGHAEKSAPKHRFTMATLRGMQQPELSRKLFKMIKTENHVINAYEAASRERVAIGTQLSEWGESTGDDSVSEIADKLGVVLAEIGEQEDVFAQNLEDYRAVLKQIRNTESSVQPSRDHKTKVADEIQKLKNKEPQSTKLVQLEQELVRAEAQNLVAEAQLTNVTRQKLKEAYDIHFAATIERAEKQIMLARHGRRLLNLLDDTPIVPGDSRPAFEYGHEARQVLSDAEEDLRDWHPTVEPVPTASGLLEQNLMPVVAGSAANSSVGPVPGAGSPPRSGSPLQAQGISETAPVAEDEIHPAYRKGSGSGSPSRREASGSTAVDPGLYTGPQEEAPATVA